MRRWFPVLGLLLLTGASPGPSTNVCSATTFGACKVDGTTITATGGVISAGGIPVYTVLKPSGGNDVPQIQAALNAAGAEKPPVMLSAGDYVICSQLSLTHNGTILLGPAPSNPDNGSIGGPGGLSSSARLDTQACGSSTFTNGQAILFVNSQYDTIMNLDFLGTNGGTHVDCIQTVTGGSIIRFNSFGGCYNGINISAVNTGCCGTFNQDNHVDFNILVYTLNNGIICQVTTGSGCTDNFITNNHIDVAANNFSIACNFGCGNSQITGNRAEDGAEGISISYAAQTAVFLIVTDNYFQNITPLQMGNAFNFTVSNNQFNCDISAPAVEFSNTNASFVFIGNTQSGCTAMYLVDAGGSTSTSSFNDPGNTPLYANAYTGSQIEPHTSLPLNSQQQGRYSAITPVGTTFTPLLDGNQRAFELDLTANSTLADFTYHATRGNIIFKFQQDATGSRTVTYNAAYLNPPTIGATASLCSFAEGYMLSSSFVFTGASVNNVACN